jgi:hypothetical protein
MADFCVAPGNGNSLDLGDNDAFVYGLPWGIDAPWSDSAVLRIVSEDGTQKHDFQKSDGESVDDFVVFTFTEAKPDVLYRGKVVDGDLVFDLFGSVELWRLQDPSDPCTCLPLPDDSDSGDSDSGDSDSGDGDSGDSDSGDGDSGDSDSGDSDSGDSSDGDDSDDESEPESDDGDEYV